jgi:hypothetical protein
LREPAYPDRIDKRLEICRRGLPAGGEAGELANQLKRPPGSLAKAGGPAQIDGLCRDEQLKRHNPRGEIGHLRKPPGRERSHRGAVLDPFSLARTHHFEGDRVSERARLRRDRLRGPGELGEGLFAGVRLGGEAGWQPGEGVLQQLNGPFGSCGDHGSQSDTGKVKSGGDRYDVEVAYRDDAPFTQNDGGIALCGVQLGLDRAPDVGEGVPGGAEDLRDAPESQRILQVPGVTGLEQAAPGE